MRYYASIKHATAAENPATTTTGNGLTLNEFYDVLGRRYYVGFRAQF